MMSTRADWRSSITWTKGREYTMKKWISLLMALLMALSLLPELALAEPELTLEAEDAPAVLSASDDLDTRLSNAGFTAPQMGSINGDPKDFYLRTPWQDGDCVFFAYDGSGMVGKLTVTLKPATPAKWKALYEAEKQQDFGFDDSLDINIRSDAPVSTVRGAGHTIR